jgi:phenylalanyl-tRNA synthetase beta chain
MANVKFSRKEFEKHCKLTKEIQEKIPLFGTPLESLTDEEIEIEIFPNRPDLYSLQGYLRGFLSFLGKKKTRQYKIEKPEKNFTVTIDKSVESIRPYTACAIVKNLKFNDEKIKEIIDIQEKIHTTLGRNRKKIAIGIYPLEKISLPIAFKAMKPKEIKFIPLEETREMSGLEILQRTSTGREYSHLLEGKAKYPVFIDSKNEVLSMPPIINSHKTGKITEQTSSVFIECSGFDFSILKKTLNILTTILSDMGGKIYSMHLNYPDKKETTPDLTPEKTKISIEDCNKLLGLKLKESDIKNLLSKMGHSYDSKTKNVLSPAWRTDILHPVDIYEDIAIAYGYDLFIPEIPPIATIGLQNKRQETKTKISEILIGLGFQEVSSFSLTTPNDQFKKMNSKPKQDEKIEVLDSKTDYKILKQDLTHSNLKILSDNLDAEYPA